eukprot:gene23806-biopygen14903
MFSRRLRRSKCMCSAPVAPKIHFPGACGTKSPSSRRLEVICPAPVAGNSTSSVPLVSTIECHGSGKPEHGLPTQATRTPKVHRKSTGKSAVLAVSAARSGHSEAGPCPNRMIRKAPKSLSSDASKERFRELADAFSSPEWRFRVFGT